MKSLINMTDKQHDRKLRARHRTGTIYRNLYLLSLILAMAALITLLLQVSNSAFGPVLTVPLNAPGDLADKPLEELTTEEISEIIVDEMDAGLLNLVRDNYGTLSGVAFVEAPLSESLSNATFPSAIEDQLDELTFGDLNNAQLADFLRLNASESQLRTWLDDEVVGEDIIYEWSWLTGLFNRSKIYVDASEELSGDVAREALDAAEDDMTVETLAAGLVDATGVDNAATIADAFVTGTTTVIETDWDVERRRRDVTMVMNETGDLFTASDVTENVALATQPEVVEIFVNAGTPEEIAQVISVEISEMIAEDGGVEEFSSLEQRRILAPMIEPAFVETLRAGNYPLAEISSHSWLNGQFLVARGQNSIPEQASLRTAILGSVWVMIITMLTAFPIGVGAAIYLEEYANDNWLNRIIETNIRNLAGVPSIIYGLLGLAVFVRGLALITSGQVFTGSSETLNGRTVMSAGLTLALLILPVIIINSQEAIRAVPSTIREASYGLGATKWQTIWRQVLPAAVPGILTGTILSFSRAVGETAPLIVVGAATAINADPSLFTKFTVIPIQIFGWTEESRSEYQHLAAAAIIVLLVLLILLNATAVTLRNRYSKASN